ncbi:MAG: SWIM zinc finger family protein, partial [Bacteroidetes bacterium]|nr:SWIM zinc finger family protein [Bacteroidota bacterium]
MNLSGKVRTILQLNSNATPYKKGLRIYQKGLVELEDLELGMCQARFLVESESHYNAYEVEIYNFDEPISFSSSCTCPYDIEPVCKHAFAALQALVEELEYIELTQQVRSIISGTPAENLTPDKSSNREDFSYPIPIFRLQAYASIGRGGIWPIQNMANYIQDFKLEGNSVSGKVSDYSKMHTPRVTLEENRYLKCDCTCSDVSKPLCKHGYALVYSMANQMKCPEDALFPLRNHDDKIAEKLAEYGFTLEDKWQDFFDIEIYFHSVELIPKDPGLSKIAAFSDWKNEISFYIDSNHEIDPEAFRATRSDYGILWNYDHKGSAHIFLNLLTGKRKKNGELGAPLRIHSSQDMNEDELSKDQLEIIDLLRRAKVAHKVYDYSHWGYSSRNQDVEIEDLIAHFNRINEVYDQLLVEDHYFSVEPQNRNTVASRHTRKIFPQAGRLSLQFEFRKGPNHFLLKPLVTIDEVVIPLHKLEAIDYGVYLLSDNLYLLDKKSARVAMFFLNKKAYRIRHEDLEPFAEQFLLPLMEQFPINMVGDHLKIEEREGIIGRKLYLKEVEEYLLFIPSITYEIAKGVAREVYFDGGNSLSYKDKDGQLYSISRNQEEEKEVWEK